MLYSQIFTKSSPLFYFSLWIVFVPILLGGCSPNQIETEAKSIGLPQTIETELPLNQRVNLNQDLHLKQIKNGVFVVTHEFPWPANSLIVEMDNGQLVLVDTPYTPEATRDLIAWLKLEFGERDIVAINTGPHVDNLGGNKFLVEQGIPVYGSELTAEWLMINGERTQQLILTWLEAAHDQYYYEGHQQITYVPPTQLFKLDENPELQFGDETIQIYYPGAGHTPDNIVVYFPSKKVLFGGCMILAGDTLGNTTDADLDEWPNSVERLSQFDVEILIPGHGTRFDAGLLTHTSNLLSEIQ